MGTLPDANGRGAHRLGTFHIRTKVQSLPLCYACRIPPVVAPSRPRPPQRRVLIKLQHRQGRQNSVRQLNDGRLAQLTLCLVAAPLLDAKCVAI